MKDAQVLEKPTSNMQVEAPTEVMGLAPLSHGLGQVSLNALAEQGSIRLPKEILSDPEGQVTGFCTSSFGEMPKEAHFLPSGAKAEISAGQAVSIMTSHNTMQGAPMWETFQFPAGGQIEGPLVWGWGDIVDRQALVLEASSGTTYRKAVRAGMVSAFAAAFANLAAASFVYVSHGVAPELFTVWLAFGSVASAFIAFFGVGFPVQSRLRRKAKLNSDSFDGWVNQEKRIPLNQRLKDMTDYIAGAGRDDTPAIQQGSIDVEVARALAEYRPRWREAQAHRDSIDRATFKMLEHSAGLIGNIASRISGSPQLLRNNDIRTSFRSLIERARADVEMALKRQVIAAEASVLGDIKALERQLDQHGIQS